MATISYVPKVINLDPVTRVEGHLKVEVTVDLVGNQQQVVDARVSGTMFRGIEKILTNRTPLDAPDITQRICGVCPVSHALASTRTLELAAGMTAPTNARLMRNLVLGANYLQSHILHFYVLSALDYVEGPDMPPWRPSWKGQKITWPASEPIVNHYVQALDIRRMCHEMGALFGGRLPHPPTYVPGGFTTTPRADRILKFKDYLTAITKFINEIYVPDVNAVANIYKEYFKIGRGHGNLLAYGVFDLDDAGTTRLLGRGRMQSGSTMADPVDTNAITENVTYSWYSSRTNNLKPESGVTNASYPKRGAYSWLKAPRYNGLPYEVGPLARMRVNGDYGGSGVSVMDRHLSRAKEAVKVATAMAGWVADLKPGLPVYQQYTVPASGSGVGLTEAPRGALGHWIRIQSGKTANYQIVTPTCWNASPRDDKGRRGPIEEALIGTPVVNTDEPIEVVRVIHSFDPCLSCAVHVMRPSEGARIFHLGL